MLLQKLIIDRIKALKAKDLISRKILEIVISEAEYKRTTDDKVVYKIIEHNIRDLKTCIQHANEQAKDKLVKELTILESYLPIKLSEEILASIIDELLIVYGSELSSVSKIIKDLKDRHPNQIDFSIVNNLLRAKLS